jgi:hypothetical protein
MEPTGRRRTGARKRLDHGHRGANCSAALSFIFNFDLTSRVIPKEDIFSSARAKTREDLVRLQGTS